MAIRTNVKITTRNKKGKLIEHPKGSIISDFDEAEEKRLIANGSAEAVETVDTSSEMSTEDEKEEGQDATSGPATEYSGA